MDSTKLIAILERTAKEIREEGHNGWGNAIDMAIDALAEQGEAPAAEGWRTMDSAPVDTRLLVWVEKSGVCFGRAVRYSDDTISLRAEGHTGDWKITHWRHVPASPNAASQDGGRDQ